MSYHTNHTLSYCISGEYKFFFISFFLEFFLIVAAKVYYIVSVPQMGDWGASQLVS